MLGTVSSYAQSSYKEGDLIKNFDAAVILNSTVKAGSFNDLKKEITIIDFFGTWCGPCIKALPILDRIQKEYSSHVAVVLLSVEKEAQLKKFIASRKDFAFPVIADAGNSISNLFQPPSYPYTVVVSSENRIIAITEAETITDKKIIEWLANKAVSQNNSSLQDTSEPKTDIMATAAADNNPVTQLSAAFIYAAKTGNDISGIEKKLQALGFDDLKGSLKSDHEKKAFWINIYNGYTQLLLKKDATIYKKRNKFFKAKQINIAGKKFSLDEIEHDFLRRSKIKWSLGYLNKLFPSKTAKSLRVDHIDYRIHFALNCGAKSCPPIAFYDPANLESQLESATRAYLTSEATYDAENNSLQLPAIMGWFRRDFKGKKNMLLLVKKYPIVPAEKNPSISFKKYDWNLYLNNYKN